MLLQIELISGLIILKISKRGNNKKDLKNSKKNNQREEELMLNKKNSNNKSDKKNFKELIINFSKIIKKLEH